MKRQVLPFVLTFILAGCVPRGFMEQCSNDSDCKASDLHCVTPNPDVMDTDYQCDTGDRVGTQYGSYKVCTMTCNSSSDCPRVPTGHCGQIYRCICGICDNSYGVYGCL